MNRTNNSSISQNEIFAIRKEIEIISGRVNTIEPIIDFPYTEAESNYLNMIRKRILEHHKINIQVISISQESFWCSITKPGQKITEGIILDDGYWYEEALSSGILYSLDLIENEYNHTTHEPIVTEKEVEEQVTKTIEHYAQVHRDQFNTNTKLIDLSLEYLDIAEILASLKRTLKVTYINPNTIWTLSTIGDIISYFKTKTQ